ncbi:hypothetical protein D1007_18298 [Hordeum vulgare]|nr:hypothetical protein D1007_18298 [Hordeum vulgare]
MCAEPTSLAVLMAKADKYATADSAMRIKVTALDKVVPAPATPKPAGDNRGGQNNYKRKADQMDPRSNNKLVANVEGEASASQAGPPRKRRNQGNPNWLPKQSLEQLLDAPCKIHSGATPSTHTLRQCSIARRLSQGEGLPAPPGAQAAPRAPAPITLRFRRHRLAMTVLTLTTILTKTERSRLDDTSAAGSASYAGCGPHAGCAGGTGSKCGTD